MIDLNSIPHDQTEAREAVNAMSYDELLHAKQSLWIYINEENGQEEHILRFGTMVMHRLRAVRTTKTSKTKAAPKPQRTVSLDDL